MYVQKNMIQPDGNTHWVDWEPSPLKTVDVIKGWPINPKVVAVRLKKSLDGPVVCTISFFDFQHLRLAFPDGASTVVRLNDEVATSEVVHADPHELRSPGEPASSPVPQRETIPIREHPAKALGTAPLHK